MLKTNSVFYFDSNDFINISHHYIDQANYKLAGRAVKMGLNQHPNNVDLMLLNSELLIFNSKYDAAYEILNFVQEIDPENREVYLQKATIYSKNNLSEEAIEILKSALSFIDDKIDIWNMIAMEFLLIEDFESAIPFFKKCLDYDDEDYQSLYNLVFCYENLGLIDESISELSHVLEKRPYSKIAWHQLGKIYKKQGKLKEAISAFDFAIISDDQFVSAYIEKAKILEKVRKYNLKNINFTIKKGDYVGLVGKSGSGKSTLTCLPPCSGLCDETSPRYSGVSLQTSAGLLDLVLLRYLLSTAAPYRLRFSVATKASDSFAANGRTKASIFEGVLSTGSGRCGVLDSACKALSLAAASSLGQASARAHTRGTSLGGGGVAAASSASSATLSLNVG